MRSADAGLDVAYGPHLLPAAAAEPWTMWRYRGLLPLPDGEVRFPIPVGGTPLLGPQRLRRHTGMPQLWIKDETWGPSASNKDRATALVLESGLRRGATAITTSSTGNAALSTALGAAACGLHATIFVPVDCNPDKTALMRLAGARVIRVRDGYQAACRLSVAAAREFGWLDRNTGVNPLTLHAKKTVALEIWEQLGRRAPDAVVVPVGDGPTVVGMAIGFSDLVACGVLDRVPRLIGVQARGCAPVARTWAGLPPTAVAGTLADGIRVPEPVLGDEAVTRVRETGGAYVTVTDDELTAAVVTLARYAGTVAEPAGAAALAGALRAVEQDVLDPAASVVILVTGRELAMQPTSAPAGEEFVIDGRLEEVAELPSAPGVPAQPDRRFA